MLAALIIAGVVLATIIAAVRRLADRGTLPLAVWPLFLAAGLMPAFIAVQVLDPGPPIESATVRKLGDTAALTIPEGHAILVTATLLDLEPDEPNSGKTDYSLNLQGDGWQEAASGIIKRKVDPDGPDVDLDHGQGIRETGKRRSGKWGEDLQDRIELDHVGDVQIEVRNWNGNAAAALNLDVVKAPIPAEIAWGLVAVITLGGLVLEVWKECDQLAADLAFMASYGVFLRDGVTPLDDFQEVGFAVAPAFLFGYLGIYGVSWLAVKYTSSAQAEPEPEPEPEPAPRRRGRKRR